MFYFEKKNGPHLCQLLVKSTLTFSIPDISRSSPRDPSLSGYLSTLKHPGRQRHSFQETCARYSGKIPTRSSTGWIGHRSTNPSPSAYGEWPGRINRKAGISFRRCGSVVPRLAVAVSFELRRCQWQLCSRATYWTHVQLRSFIPTYLALLCLPLSLPSSPSLSLLPPFSLSLSLSLSLLSFSTSRSPFSHPNCPFLRAISVSPFLLSSFLPFLSLGSFHLDFFASSDLLSGGSTVTTTDQSNNRPRNGTRAQNRANR